MSSTAALGGAALFLAGASVALLATYPVSEDSIIVCFIALAALLASATLGVAAVIIHVAHGAWRRSIPLVEYAVERQLDERGLYVVEND